MKNHFILTLLFLFFFAISGIQAAPLKNIPVKVVHVNGDTLHCFASGDEFYNYLHDEAGFTLIQNDEGYYMYAVYDGANIVASKYRAGVVNPALVGLQPHVTISREEYQARRAAWFDFEDIPRPKTPGINHGTLNNLVVFIRFADEGEITTPFTVIDNMFNNQTQGFNSMINYFNTASYGHLNIPSFAFPEPEGNLILSYQDDYPRSYYQPYHEITNPNGYQGGDNGSERTDREHELLRNAIEYIADMVPEDLDLDYNNDGLVDNVCFIIKGNNDDWANLLWPHRWSLYSKYAAIHGKRVYDYNFQLEGGYFNNAVLCHEMQHSLGYPDLYHYANGGPSPVGNWDIMESNPNPPQQSGAYMKWKYGNWLHEPVEIQPGRYTLNSIGSGAGVVSFKIPSSDPIQFFIMELRNSNDPFENFNYGYVNGMLVYRINVSWSGNAGYDPNNGVFDEVYIFRPGGNNPNQNGNLNQAHFGANGRNTFDANSNPKPFLTDGTYITDLSLTDITVTGNRVSFTYNGGTTQFYGVTFLPNGGKGLMPPQMFEAEVEQELRSNSFMLEGKVFEGWALTPNGERVYTNAQSIAIEEDMELYALWADPPPPPPVYYTITAEVVFTTCGNNGCGTIEPEGVIEVLENTSQTFVMEVCDGAPNFISIVIIDGIEYEISEDEKYRMEYTFENVAEDHTIKVNFGCLGITDNLKSNVLFSIQPNPATQYFEIVLPQSSISSYGVTAQIFDFQGLLLKTVSLFDEKTRIDISNFVKGFYIVKIGKEAKKLIVK